jgi:hypothetical protein
LLQQNVDLTDAVRALTQEVHARVCVPRPQGRRFAPSGRQLGQ